MCRQSGSRLHRSKPFRRIGQTCSMMIQMDSPTRLLFGPSITTSRPFAVQKVRLGAERLPSAILHYGASELLFCSILRNVFEVTGHRDTFAPHIPSHRSTREKETKREHP